MYLPPTTTLPLGFQGEYNQCDVILEIDLHSGSWYHLGPDIS
jgi:hypothetical protein